MERKLTLVAGIVACAILLVLPALHVASEYRSQQAIVSTEAEINAHLLTQLVNANPELWTVATHRLNALLARRPRDGTPEIRAVYDSRNNLVTQVADPMDGPHLSVRSPLYDSGRIVGKLEISRSLRPLIYSTAFVLLLASALGGAAFAALRILPIRALQRAVNQLVEERERGAVAERERQAAEAASRVKAQFLANMSHEMRTPLNGVLGLTEVMLQSDLNAEQRRLAETLLRSGETLLRLVNDVLDFSKMDAGKLELRRAEFSVRDVVEDVSEILAPVAHKAGLDIICDFAPSLPPAAIGDASRLGQILMNLMGNAIKFTERGEIVVSAAVETSAGAAESLLLDVRDTGIGMDTETVARIFDPFTQADQTMSRRFGGTGLGLTITRQLVELMGGSLHVESEVGRGSTFQIRLPLTRARSDNASPPLAEVRPLAGRRILIVEASPTYCRVVRRDIEGLGGEAVAVSDARAALAPLRAAKMSEQPFDAVVLGEGLPGVGGVDLARSIRADVSLSAMKLVLSLRGGDNAARGYAGVADGRLNRPARQRQLRTELLRVLGVAHPRPAATADTTPHVERNSLRVLLAEDNATNRLVATSMLRKAGIEVHSAENGLEAVSAAAEHSFDLVLMDCQMPEMDGFEATASIRRSEAESRNRLPVIAVTANTMAGDRQRCLAAGFDDYLPKPFRQAELLAMIDKWTAAAHQSNS